jgi:site-specific recombinase XerD
MLSKFSWWLSQEEIPDRLEAITPENIRFFLAYLRGDAAGSRWGGKAVNAARPARPSTVDTYYRCLRAFSNFVVREGLLDESPMAKIRPPRVPKDQV